MDNFYDSLFEASLYPLQKSTGESKGDLWKFAGVAMDESRDIQGDSILRKALDLSYIQRRGYVNWDHSRAPEDQLGSTVKAELLKEADVPRLEDTLQVPLGKSASVYVEGYLYKNVPRAKQVMEILKSIPDGSAGSLGLSAEGSMVRMRDESRKVVKAFVRGVAVTPWPAQTNTLMRLSKSLGELMAELKDDSSMKPNQDMSETWENLGKVGREIRTMQNGLSFAESVLRLLEMRPNFPVGLAKQIVQYVFDAKAKQSDGENDE